jgi:hypothetical protein
MQLLSRTCAYAALFLVSELFESNRHNARWLASYTLATTNTLAGIQMALQKAVRQPLRTNNGGREAQPKDSRLEALAPEPLAVQEMMRSFSLFQSLSNWSVVLRSAWILVASAELHYFALLQVFVATLLVARLRWRSMRDVAALPQLLRLATHDSKAISGVHALSGVPESAPIAPALPPLPPSPPVTLVQQAVPTPAPMASSVRRRTRDSRSNKSADSSKQRTRARHAHRYEVEQQSSRSSDSDSSSGSSISDTANGVYSSSDSESERNTNGNNNNNNNNNSSSRRRRAPIPQQQCKPVTTSSKTANLSPPAVALVDSIPRLPADMVPMSLENKAAAASAPKRRDSTNTPSPPTRSSQNGGVVRMSSAITMSPPLPTSMITLPPSPRHEELARMELEALRHAERRLLPSSPSGE